MLFDLINFSKLRRAIVYVLVFAVILLIQDLLLSHITIRGIKALLMPAAVAAVGLFEGGLWGGLFGLAAGYICDWGFTEQVVLFTILFPVTGFLSGFLGKYLFHNSLLSYMVIVFLFMLIITFCQMFSFLFLTDTDVWPVLRTGIIQILWSLPWAVPIYFLCKKIAGRSLQ